MPSSNQLSALPAGGTLPSTASGPAAWMTRTSTRLWWASGQGDPSWRTASPRVASRCCCSSAAVPIRRAHFRARLIGSATTSGTRRPGRRSRSSAGRACQVISCGSRSRRRSNRLPHSPRCVRSLRSEGFEHRRDPVAPEGGVMGTQPGTRHHDRHDVARSSSSSRSHSSP